jgi:hypothetical protein
VNLDRIFLSMECEPQVSRLIVLFPGRHIWLLQTLDIICTRRAGALRRARLLPVFAPCLSMRPANPSLTCFSVTFRVLAGFTLCN